LHHPVNTSAGLSGRTVEGRTRGLRSWWLGRRSCRTGRR
jgi:hypothetical protein